ncbi:MAG: TylF/MycF/NovP-related O-methyltransferase [Desulfomonilaceae bacterium]
MLVRALLKKLIEATGYTVSKMSKGAYYEGGLYSIHAHEFMSDPSFRRAYERGVLAAGQDYHWRWRVHIGLWAAHSASKLNGDFVECGVNRGFLSSAIMEYLNWDSLDKIFYLLDTFSGLDARYVSNEEIKSGALDRNMQDLRSGFYIDNISTVRENFSQWKNLRIIQGPVPETLDSVETERVAYLHLDMNCSPPEVAAFNYFWPRLVPGAFILLDDYAQPVYGQQKSAMDGAARTKGLQIASLPTGQGLLIKSI